MPHIPPIFDHSASFDPAADLDAFLKQVPARWVVYLFADQHDNPLQLLCVKNLRASLKRRLGGHEFIGPSKKVNYRDVVRRIHWRRVDSAFEADWIYLESARQLFPQSYQTMLGRHPAWFIHVNPDAPFPRYTKVSSAGFSPYAPGTLIGPLEDKHAAARLIEILEDAFDLCRYYNILTQAPHGKACAYKEMGRCPAPCDGSISMDQYRQTIAQSANAITNPQPFIRAQTQLMQQASSQLRFEQASRIKARIDQLSQLSTGPFRHARPLREFAFLSLQPGPRPSTAKLFLILQTHIEHTLSLISPAFDDQIPNQSQIANAVLSLPKDRKSQILDHLLSRASALPTNYQLTTNNSPESISLVSRHLFSAKQSPGIFLPLTSLRASEFSSALSLLFKQKPAEPLDSDSEGVLQELHSPSA